MYLLDTNVISELRRRRPHGAVMAWMGHVRDGDLYIAAMTLGEIQAGIEQKRDSDPDKAIEIEAWLESIATTYNILPADGAVFRCWARLIHKKSNDLIGDAMIAATAEINNLTVVTRNIRDFTKFGVRTVNPFETA